jgi:hypothetical protein
MKIARVNAAGMKNELTPHTHTLSGCSATHLIKCKFMREAEKLDSKSDRRIYNELSPVCAQRDLRILIRICAMGDGSDTPD